MHNIQILLLVALLVSHETYAQQDTSTAKRIAQDSLQSDMIKSTNRSKIKIKTSKLKPHSVKTAVLLEIIPGGGQIYNRTYWKLPIVYGGLGGLGYWMVDSGAKYRCYRRAYREAVDEDPTTNYRCKFDVDALSSADLKVRRDQFQRNFEFAVISFSAFYILTIVDAFVEAHLTYFDMGDDLSIAIRPKLQHSTARRHLMPSLGLSFRPTFKTCHRRASSIQF